MIDWIARRRQLREEDPHGRRSDNDLDKQIKVEQLHDAVAALPDCGELAPIRDILSDIVALIEINL